MTVTDQIKILNRKIYIKMTPSMIYIEKQLKYLHCLLKT